MARALGSRHGETICARRKPDLTTSSALGGGIRGDEVKLSGAAGPRRRQLPLALTLSWLPQFPQVRGVRQHRRASSCASPRATGRYMHGRACAAIPLECPSGILVDREAGRSRRQVSSWSAAGAAAPRQRVQPRQRDRRAAARRYRRQTGPTGDRSAMMGQRAGVPVVTGCRNHHDYRCRCRLVSARVTDLFDAAS